MKRFNDQYYGQVKRRIVLYKKRALIIDDESSSSTKDVDYLLLK